MDKFRLKTPVVFIIFNRPDTTSRVFEEIRKARPPKLLVVADGPRDGRPDDRESCAAARAVIDGVDWDCEVLTNFAESNMGCKDRVCSGMDWAFEKSEEVIVLEDDCLPDGSFFRYCEELLGRYRNDERVAMISGGNYQFGRRRTVHSYYFSKYTHVWGWASWRRTWRHVDPAMKLWPEIRDGGWLNDLLGEARVVDYWGKKFEQAYLNEADAWSINLLFACWTQNGLTVLPNVNLISNIGFGSGGTHTTVGGKLACLGTEPMNFPLSHPKFMLCDSSADGFTEGEFFSGRPLPPLRTRACNRIRRMLKV